MCVGYLWKSYLWKSYLPHKTSSMLGRLEPLIPAGRTILAGNRKLVFLFFQNFCKIWGFGGSQTHDLLEKRPRPLPLHWFIRLDQLNREPVASPVHSLIQFLKHWLKLVPNPKFILYGDGGSTYFSQILSFMCHYLISQILSFIGH